MAMMLRTRGSGLRLGCTAWAGMRGIADVLGFGEAWEKAGGFRMLRARGNHVNRSEEHTSELQSLMRISYAVFCLKNKKKNNEQTSTHRKTYNIEYNDTLIIHTSSIRKIE